MVSKSQKSTQNFEKLVSQFDYDTGLPLQVEEAGIEDREGISIQDLSFAGPGKERLDVYWVIPAGRSPFPGLVFVHPAPGDRSTFLDEAVMVAKQGIASLLFDAPWSQGEAFGQILAEPEPAREALIRVVISLRRAVDFLASRAEIDPEQLGFTGHSFGAQVGGVLSGVEKRIKAFVLMAGTGSFTDAVALNMPFLDEQALENYRRVMEPIEPVSYVAHAAPSALFFQFGQKDSFYSREVFDQYAAAASEPNLVKWYDTDHFFQNDAARRDRLKWLESQLLA